MSENNDIAGAIIIIGSLFLGLQYGFQWWNYVLIGIGLFGLFVD